MIRFYHKNDSAECAEIMRSCVEMMEEYQPDLRGLLFEKRTADWVAKKFAEYDAVWVYERDGRVLGFISLDVENIEGLYVDPLHHHEDIASELLQTLESYAEKNKIAKLRVESSFFAEPFYLGAGYRTIEKGQVEVGGFTVLFIDMEKEMERAVCRWQKAVDS